ncbi:MAG: ABC transporter ATP-binding protein [Deinococcales bacterium]
MQTLLKYLAPHRGLVALTLVLAAVNTGFSLLDPIITGQLVKLAFEQEKKPLEWAQFLPSVLGLLGASVGVAMVSRIAKNFQDYCLNVVVQKFGARVFQDGLQHAMKLPYQDFEDSRSGETLSVLTKVRADVEKLMNYVINVLFGVVVAVLFVFCYAALFVHWSMPIAYLGGAVVMVWATNALSKRLKLIQKTIVAKTNALAGATTESLRNIELVKSLGLTSQEVQRLNHNTQKILGLELEKVRHVRGIGFVQGTLVNTLRQVILFILMYLLFGKQVRPEQLITMQFLAFFVFGPMQEIGNVLLSYREAEASLNNFERLMQKPPETVPSAPVALGAVRQLRFTAVSFKHQSAAHNALTNIDFAASKGETIAFVGPSGSGKSTLMKLLVGLYKPLEGQIFYNDIPSQSINLEELRAQIGFVTQDTQLFSGTIRENLLFVAPHATERELHAALEQAACNSLLAKADKGLDTTIGEGGLKLSGGERQRLSIARALLRQPKILIFDEATSALDSITEEEINQTIRDISSRGEQITILIAHRLSTIMHADRIYVLERGEIVETGTHEALLLEKGLYYAMWRQQIGERKLPVHTAAPRAAA